MTQEEIIEMAKQAGYQHPDAVGTCEDFAYFELEAFAKLITEKEREACAEIADRLVDVPEHNFSALIAHNIRARGYQKGQTD